MSSKLSKEIGFWTRDGQALSYAPQELIFEQTELIPACHQGYEKGCPNWCGAIEVS